MHVLGNAVNDGCRCASPDGDPYRHGACRGGGGSDGEQLIITGKHLRHAMRRLGLLERESGIGELRQDGAVRHIEHRLVQHWGSLLRRHHVDLL